ncbi:hypothetical protein PSP6_80099 [Paraburkholderia tropica]|nr:hypothetical protein PSP6_80099 [Paraburkholderia tropica]
MHRRKFSSLRLGFGCVDLSARRKVPLTLKMNTSWIEG